MKTLASRISFEAVARSLTLLVLLLAVSALGAPEQNGGNVVSESAPPLGIGGIGVSAGVLERIAPERGRNDNPRVARCKGAFLRTEERGRKSQYELVAEVVAVGTFRQPALKISLLERQIITEIRLYEVLLRTISSDGDGTAPISYDYERVDGEVWEGETNQRIVVRGTKPFAEKEVLVNDIPLRTDAGGIVLDPLEQLDILGRFDELGTRSVRYLISSEQYGSVEFTMTRTMPQRNPNDERRIEEDDRHELLIAAYDLDFRLSKGEPEQELLQCELVLPADFAYAVAGKAFPLTVKVTNSGKRQTSCLIARTFSRIDGLNGKLFYFGAILPGETRTFTRMVRVGAAEKSNSAALEVRFSDSWSIPKQRLPLRFSVIH